MDRIIEINLTREYFCRLEEIQYQFFDGRPKWTTLKFKDLMLYAAYTYFGSPIPVVEITDSLLESNDIFNLYNQEEKTFIINMIKIIKKNIIKHKNENSEIQVGITITHSVCINKCDYCQHFPEQDIHKWYLLRIQTGNNQVVYIDFQHERTYKNWDDYLENNTLPEGYMFFPLSGYYNEENNLASNLTPPSRISNKIIRNVDLVGKLVNSASSALLASAWLFPVLTPVIIPSAVSVAACSVYSTGRQVSKLSDISEHNESLVSSKACKVWLELIVSSLGIISAPMNTTCQLSKSALLTSNLEKTLFAIKKGVFITQSSLELFQLGWRFKDENYQMSFQDFLTIRLDLLLVLGKLVPLNFICILFTKVRQVLPMSEIQDIIMDMPRFIYQSFMNVEVHFKLLASTFLEKASKFLEKNLTLDKLFCAWKDISCMINRYKQSQRDYDDARRGEEDIWLKYLEQFAAEDRDSVKEMLSGDQMCNLVDWLRPQDANLMRFTQYCIERTLKKAAQLITKYQETVADCERLAGCGPSDGVNQEFCLQYGLNGCGAVDFVTRAMRDLADDKLLLSEWPCYQSTKLGPLVHEYTDGLCSMRAYSMASPPSPFNLHTCEGIASALDPLDSGSFSSSNLMFDGTVPDVCLLLSLSVFSMRIAFYRVISSSCTNDPPSLQIIIYHKKLQSSR